MAIRLYNTLTRRVEPFETLEPGLVRMYVCGVTPYDRTHLGHALSAIVFDVLRRFLEWRGYRVRHVVNVTDVDDKIIARAAAEGRDPRELAEQYAADYLQQLAALNVLPATAYPRATEAVPAIVAAVGRLVDGGYAYPAGGDVYFRVARARDYGRLSGRTAAAAGGAPDHDPERGGAPARGPEAGADADGPEAAKEAPADFALWKGARPGEPAWPSPWGPGRPGWHIECSAMILERLGEQIDVHGGGSDLLFPHHENERAQSEAITGKPLARFWLHNGMLRYVDPATGRPEKMSKSLGNVVAVADFLQRYDADVLRLLVLGGAYRSPLTYNEDVAADHARGLERLAGALRPATGTPGAGPKPDGLGSARERARDRFVEALEDDLNTAGALAALFELVRAINAARAAGAGEESLGAAQAELRELAGVLGLRLQETRAPAPAPDIAPFVEILIDTREALRRARQFALADAIRERLAAAGVLLEDGPQGTRWRTTG
jgi:cysteinyl-tRNA synthetase